MLEKETVVEKKKLGIATLTMITVAAVVLVVMGTIVVIRMLGKASLSVAVT